MLSGFGQDWVYRFRATTQTGQCGVSHSGESDHPGRSLTPNESPNVVHPPGVEQSASADLITRLRSSENRHATEA